MIKFILDIQLEVVDGEEIKELIFHSGDIANATVSLNEGMDTATVTLDSDIAYGVPTDVFKILD